MFGFFKKKKKIKKDALISLLESLPIIYDSAENEQKMIDFFDAIICYANKKDIFDYLRNLPKQNRIHFLNLLTQNMLGYMDYKIRMIKKVKQFAIDNNNILSDETITRLGKFVQDDFEYSETILETSKVIINQLSSDLFERPIR